MFFWLISDELELKNLFFFPTHIAWQEIHSAFNSKSVIRFVNRLSAGFLHPLGSRLRYTELLFDCSLINILIYKLINFYSMFFSMEKPKVFPRNSINFSNCHLFVIFLITSCYFCVSVSTHASCSCCFMFTAVSTQIWTQPFPLIPSKSLNIWVFCEIVQHFWRDRSHKL